MWLSGAGYCLRRTESGEGRLRLSIFLRDAGLVAVWVRVSGKRRGGVAIPDLFQRGEFSVRKGRLEGAGWLEEFHVEERFSGLGRSYRRLREASALAGFVEANLRHMEDFGEAWRILGSGLAALETAAVEEVVLFKGVFALARAEGYAVATDWLAGQGGEAGAIRECLGKPVRACVADGETVRRWRRGLFRYVGTRTDLIAPQEEAYNGGRA